MNSSSLYRTRPVDLRIVLVRSIYERNVGATSRAMANMGIHRLILVAPQCELTIEAQKAAATGQEALTARTVYTDWNHFFQNEPRGLFIATTARDGRGRQVQDLEKSLTQFRDSHESLNKAVEEPFIIHLVFGPEDWGLSAGDIQYANACCSIPIYGDNTSLNLSQATLLAMYIFRNVFGGTRTQFEGHQKPKERQIKPAVFPDQTLKMWLQEMGFKLDKKKINVFTVLRRMLLQNAPSTKEFRTLEIVLQQSIRKLRQLNQIQANRSPPGEPTSPSDQS